MKLFLVFLFIVSTSFSREVSLKVFETNKVPKDYFVWSSIVKGGKRLNTKLKFKTRFIVKDLYKLNTKNLLDEKSFNKLNRKTKFKKKPDGEFLAVRPSFPFDIKFTLNADIKTGDETLSYIENTAFKKRPEFVLIQVMSKYNYYFDETHSYILVFKISESTYLVENYGYVSFKKSLPNFVISSIYDEYPSKLAHFRKNLSILLRNN